MRISQVTGSRELVVLVVDGQEIVALDGTSGVRRWQATVDGRVSAVQLIGDRALVQSSPAGAPGGRVTALDRADGREVWRRDVDAGADVAIDGGQVLLARRTGARATAVEVVDATTGSTRAIVGGDDVTWDDRTIQRRLGSDVELIDRASLRTVADVDLARLGLPLDDGVAAVRTASGVVVVAGTTPCWWASGATSATRSRSQSWPVPPVPSTSPPSTAPARSSRCSAATCSPWSRWVSASCGSGGRSGRG